VVLCDTSSEGLSLLRAILPHDMAHELTISCCRAQFLPHDVAHELEDMLAHDGGAATIKISHRPYDWGVNTAEY